MRHTTHDEIYLFIIEGNESIFIQKYVYAPFDSILLHTLCGRASVRFVVYPLWMCAVCARAHGSICLVATLV